MIIDLLLCKLLHHPSETIFARVNPLLFLVHRLLWIKTGFSTREVAVDLEGIINTTHVWIDEVFT